MSYDVPPRIDPSKLSVDQMAVTARLNFNRVLQVEGKSEDEVRESFRTAMRLHSLDDHDDDRMSLREQLAERRARLAGEKKATVEETCEDVRYIDLDALDKAGLIAFADGELQLPVDKRKSETALRALIAAHLKAMA